MDKIVEKIIEDIEEEIRDNDDRKISFNPATQSAYMTDGTPPREILSYVMNSLEERIDEELINNGFYDNFYDI